MQTERDSLREMNEELKCTQAPSGGFPVGAELEDSTSKVEMLSLPPEIK